MDYWIGRVRFQPRPRGKSRSTGISHIHTEGKQLSFEIWEWLGIYQVTLEWNQSQNYCLPVTILDGLQDGLGTNQNT